jgi:ubiquitin-protein ligase
MLPDEGDDGVNYMDFRVEIEAPDYYTVDPSPSSLSSSSSSSSSPSPPTTSTTTTTSNSTTAGRELPYKGGMFSVQLSFSDAYPVEPPLVRFLTRIWHPQVHLPDGKPCVDVLNKAWTPTKTLKDVLETLRALIAEPSRTDSVNADAASEMMESLDKFEAHAREETRKWAMNT